jgi:hypothetical protein
MGGLPGLACQGTQLGQKIPTKGSKQVLKNLRRAQRLVQQAAAKKVAGKKRKLKQATKLLQQVLPNIVNLPIPSAQATALIQQIYGLLDQMKTVLSDLQNAGGSK